MGVEVFTPARSSFIGQIEFDDRTDTMTVTFADGKRFAYSGVAPATYRNFTLSPSPGGFFHRHVKDAYPFEEA